MGSQAQLTYSDQADSRVERAGFLALPTGYDTASINHSTSLEQAVRSTVRRMHHELNPPWSAKLVTGADSSDATSGSIAKWVRSWMVHHADFCIICSCDRSTGCGRVRGWAVELGIPLVLLIEKNADTSPLLLGSALPEPEPVVIIFHSHADLLRKLEEWLRANAVLLANGDERRAERRHNAESEHMRQCERWRALPCERRTAIANELRIDRRDLDLILADTLEFACAPPATRDDLTRLIFPSPPYRSIAEANPSRLMDERIRRAYSGAVEEYGWDPETAAQVLLDGMDYEAARVEKDAIGAVRRESTLTKVTGWKPIHDKRFRADKNSPS